MFKILLCFLYGLPAYASVAWVTAALHHSLALGWTLAYLVAINLVAFGVYLFDKVFSPLLDALCVRVPEDLLTWGLALPGGWLGAWAGVFIADHKTSPEKAPFRRELLAAHAANVTLVLLALMITQLPPATLMQRIDPLVAVLVALVLSVVRTALEAIKALL